VDPAPEAPEVDFSKERVVALSLGPRPNGCYALRVDGVTTRDEPDGVRATVVDATEHAAPPDVMCTQEITHPFAFGAIPRRDTPVRFEVGRVVAAPP
jgi:hypothetical protein